MNRKTNRLIAVCMFLCLSVYTMASSKDSTSQRLVHIIGVDFRPAYTFPTNEFFKGANAAQTPVRKTFSGHVKYGFKFSPDTYWGRIYPYAIQGIGVGYNTFFNSSEIGNPLAVYAFQTYRIASITPRLSFDYEWNFGASFGWKKYDEETNSMNNVVGSKINAYINFGLLLNWQIDACTHLRAGVGVTHYSNGNTGYPNSGVNTIGGSIGIIRYFGNKEKMELYNKAYYTAYRNKDTFKPYVSYDLIIYGALKKKGVFPPYNSPVLVPGSFAVGGFNFTPMYNFSNYFRAGLSLDAQYDESANLSDHVANTGGVIDTENIRFHRPPFKEQFAVGLSARAEIVMPIFSINLGIGRNIICKGADTNSFYQIIALKTDITKNLFLHVGYQLYKFKDQNNLMLGIGVRLNAKR